MADWEGWYGYDDRGRPHTESELTRVTAERDRYRAALERIANHPNWYTDNGTTRMCGQACMDQVIAVAREALKP